MSLVATIRSAKMTAMKARDSVLVASFGYLMGEFDKIKIREKREASDSEVVKLLQKLSADNDATINTLKESAPDDSRISDLTRENEAVAAFLPTQMSEADISALVQGIIDDGAGNIGMVMGKLKKHPDASSIDMRVASSITKSKF